MLASTSGTSGGVPLLIIRERDLDQWKWDQLDVKEPLRIVSLMSSQTSRLAHATSMFLTYGKPVSILNLEVSDLTEDLPALLKDFNPNGFYGVPSFIVRLIESIETRDLLFKDVIFVGVMGELLTHSRYETLQTSFPRALIRSYYGSGDAGAIGPSCKFLPLNYFHVIPSVRVRIDDPDASGAGEVLVSRKVLSYTIEDHKTGDLGRIHHRVCPCGEKTSLEIIGRSGYDHVKILGALLHRDEFDRVMKMLSDYIEKYRVEVREIEKDGHHCGEITIRILPTPSCSLSPQTAEHILKTILDNLFVTPSRTLGALVQENIFLTPAIQFVRSFEVTNKDIAIRLIE